MNKNTQKTHTNILLVDDDKVFCQVLKQALQRRKYNVTVAHDLKSTIKLTQYSCPELAIVDLCIGSDSGLDVVKHLVQINPKIKAVVLTGFASISTAVESIKIGAIHYLTKPVEVDEILKAFYYDEGNTNIELQARPMSIKRMEWEHIQTVLNNNNGNISATARAMDMHRRTLQRKLSKKPVKE